LTSDVGMINFLL